MKVYVVIEAYFGEDLAGKSPVVFSTKGKAQKYCEERDKVNNKNKHNTIDCIYHELEVL